MFRVSLYRIINTQNHTPFPVKAVEVQQNRNMKKLILILLLASPVYPCGVPQHLWGVVYNGILPVRNATVTISVEGTIRDVIQTGSFGFYSTMVGACPEPHTITVKHGRYHFAPVTFWTDGSGNPIVINFPTDSARSTDRKSDSVE